MGTSDVPIMVFVWFANVEQVGRVRLAQPRMGLRSRQISVRLSEKFGNEAHGSQILPVYRPMPANLVAIWGDRIMLTDDELDAIAYTMT